MIRQMSDRGPVQLTSALGVVKDKMAKVTDIYNFRLIEDGLSTSGQPTEAQLRAVASEGYEVIINFALHDDPRYSLSDETGLIEGLGIVCVHIPVQFGAPADAKKRRG